MNTTLTDLCSRRSIRAFTEVDVPRRDLELIIEAGLSAPSAHGKRPWHIAVFSDKTVRSRIAAKMQWFQPIVDAPVSLLICGDPSACVQKEYWPVDCAALTENIMVAARSLDLGSVCCGIAPVAENIELIRTVLDIPVPLVPFCMIAIGYPKSTTAFHERNKTGDEARVTWNPQWVRPDDK